MQDDLISIVIPVYNAEKFIEETVESVVNQSYTEWELLLINDGSTDESGAVIEKLAKRYSRIKVFHLKGEGAAKARNIGTENAKGRYLAFLDADDLWDKEKLRLELDFLREKNAAFVFTGYEFANQDGKGTGKIVRAPEILLYRQALKNTTIFTSTVMFDMSKTGKELLYMPQIKSEDTALWWRVIRSGYTAYGLDLNLVKYRRSGKTLSSNKVEAIRRIWNLYRKAEGLSVVKSSYYFMFWAWNAVARRV